MVRPVQLEAALDGLELDAAAARHAAVGGGRPPVVDGGPAVDLDRGGDIAWLLGQGGHGAVLVRRGAGRDSVVLGEGPMDGMRAEVVLGESRPAAG